MEYEIITDRFEIEKMAEDIFLSDDELITNIDYADLLRIKSFGTLRHAIICDVDMQNNGWGNEFIKIIQSLQLPFDKLRAFMLNFIMGGEGPTLTQDDISDIVRFLDSIKDKEDAPDNNPYNNIGYIWTVHNRRSMPKDTLKIQLYLAYEKTKQDKQEDEKYEQMIEDYRRPFFSSDPIDFSNLITAANNDGK